MIYNLNSVAYVHVFKRKLSGRELPISALECIRLKKTKRWRDSNHLSLPSNSSALPLRHSDLQFLVSSPRQMIYKLKRVADHMCRGKSYTAAKSRTCRLRVKKTKRRRGVNPRPMVLNASSLPLHHSDLLYFVSSLRYMIYNLKRVAYV